MSIYKDCDIRGIFQEEFDEQEAYAIGKAIGTLKRGLTLVVGGDVRISTPLLKMKLIQGLLETGIRIIDIGIVTTPMFYYGIKELAADGGVMVTASHNPAKYNGFKLAFGEKPITFSTIKEIESAVLSREFNEIKGTYKTENIKNKYSKYIIEKSPLCSKKVVVDCCDGTTSEIVPEILRKLGFEVVSLYCGSDGNFPNRDPNPAVYENLAELCKKVKEEQADFGAGYDGDGDRVVFVDNLGRTVTSEKSFSIFVADKLSKEKGSVVYDQKSASVVKKIILENGGEPLMQRSGYVFIKQLFLEEGALLAGEISGHFFFKEIGNDDGLYATIKMGNILENSNRTFAELVDAMPQSLITPDLRIFCPYELQDLWLEKAKKLGNTYPMNELDGVRIEFDCGWLLIRKSVTEQAVTIRLEADNIESMQWMKKLIVSVLPELTQHEYFSS